MENRCNTKIYFLLLGILAFFPLISSFSGNGTGTLADPFQITNCTQFQEMNNSLTANYSLVNDINCSETISWNNATGFSPIGDIVAFSGSLNGQNYTISGLKINRTINDNVAAIFQTTTNKSRIYDIRFINYSIRGDFVGGLVFSNAGNISNVVLEGNTTAIHVMHIVNDGNHIGGFVNGNSGTIINSSVKGYVTGQSSSSTQTSASCGGFVYSNSGTIRYSSSNITLSCVISSHASSGTDSGAAGGFVGSNSGTITNSYTTGTVFHACGNDGFDFCYGGGFIGSNTGNGNISNCYSRTNYSWSGSYPQRLFIGGFVGAAYSTSTINNSYSTGKMSPTSVITYICGIIEGGFAGGLSTAVFGSYYDINTTQTTLYGNTFTPLTSSCGAGNGGGTGKITADMKLQSTYSGWDFTNTWKISPSINDGYPYLTYFYPTIIPTAPTITLNSPINYYNATTNNTILFNSSINPNGQFLKNISLYLNGEIIETIYLADPKTEGQYTGVSFNTIGTSPRGITNDSTTFLITDSINNKVYRQFMNGTYIANYSLPYGPDAIETNGTIVFTGKDYSVYRNDMNVSYLGSSFLLTEGENISGIDIYNNYIYITDFVTNKLYNHSINGTYTGQNWTLAGLAPRGIDNDGTFFSIVDANGYVYKYWINNMTLNSNWNTGTDSWGIWGNSTHYFVTDDANNRVKIYYKADVPNVTATEYDFIKTLNDGNYVWSIVATTSSNATNLSQYITVDLNAPTISITSPISYQSFATTNVPFTISETDDGSSVNMCWYSKNNGATNITYSCASDFSVTEAGDGTYNVIVWANDTFGHLGRAQRYYVVSSSAPAVTTNYPINTGINTIPVDLNVTATDSNGIQNCSLWANFTGTWKINETDTSVTSGVQNRFSKLLADGFYKFAFQCFDTTGLSSFSPQNFTFTVDTTAPTASINSIITTAGSQTISFSTTENDSNSFNCKYTVYKSNGQVDGLSNNITYTCNSNPHTATTTAYGTYFLNTFVTDAGNNVKSTRLSFTTSAIIGGNFTPPSTPTVGGGGGGLDINKTLEAFGFCGDMICQDGTNGTVNRGEDFYDCPDDCSKIYSIFTFGTFNFETLVSNCFSSVAETQDRCFWKKTPGLLVLLVLIVAFFVFSIFFSIKPANKGGTKRIIYNPSFKKRRR